MSLKKAGRGSNSFAIVYWVDDNEYSIEPIESIMNQEMLTDPTLVGFVKHTGCKEPALKPTNGWNKYMGRVISTRGRLCYICYTVS